MKKGGFCHDVIKCLSMKHETHVTERCINTDLKICQYLCLQMNIICRKFHIKTPITF